MRKWTFMVYMAGDNGKFFDDGEQLMANLVAAGWDDLREMSQVGSTPDVAIVAQYDTLTEQQHTPRFYVRRSEMTDNLVDKIPSVNTGDPKNLTEFVVWAQDSYPAENYALVLWNHGTGWKQDDIYARYRERVERAVRGGESRAGGSGDRVLRRSLFMSTAGEIMSIQDDESRAICYDDTSMDFLDNQKLAQALVAAEQKTGRRLAVLGMDACLMSTIEVAYQVRHHADYMVGSQEVEAADGWPYGPILRQLTERPTTSPRELSQLIVSEFGRRYTSGYQHSGWINTQSAIDLSLIKETVAKIRALSELILDAYRTDFRTEIAVLRGRQFSQSFRDVDSLDMRHLMQLVRDEYGGTRQVGELADKIVEHLALDPSRGLIISNFHGSARPNANGLSIYFPLRGCSPFYAQEVFADSDWHKVIQRVNGLTPSTV